MKTISFDVKDITDLNTMTRSRFGYCKIKRRMLTIKEMDQLAAKYNSELELAWVYDYSKNQAVPDSFKMKLEDHLYNAYLIVEP